MRTPVTSLRMMIVLLLCLFGLEPVFGLTSRVTSVSLNGGRLTMLLDAPPVVSTDRYRRGGTYYLIISFKGTILAGRARVLQDNRGDGATVDIAQFELHPDVVHVVIKSSFKVASPARAVKLAARSYALHMSLTGNRKPRVFIDVGHGGYDPGGTGPDGLPESFVNLSVAKKVAVLLKNAGFSVTLDRSRNRFVSLRARVSMADRSGADLFLGLYCNASPSSAVHGTTTYYYHSNSYKFARYLQDHVVQSLGLANDGVVKDNLYVIRHTSKSMIDVLIEYAYITNAHEETLLSSPWFRGRIAGALASAVIGYFGKQAKKSTPSSRSAAARRGPPVDLPVLFPPLEGHSSTALLGPK